MTTITPPMADRPPKKHRALSTKGARSRRRIPQPSPPPSTPPTSNELFSTDDQFERFSSHFFERLILEGKYLVEEFFQDRNFEFYNILTTAGLKDFVSYRDHFHPELVRVFYCNMQISYSRVIRSEVKKVKMTITPSLFHELTTIPSVGVLYEGNIVMSGRTNRNQLMLGN
ncbi:hypothetical protein LR48_Vigan205s002700 [Vigna angularis]|uniref:Uncharacterized protein n=1 Tax=Phaseolus angularis TaxID=3914 RepID=A0A0L9T5L1_PHAAN|nr:hypothetical protein LR48_Vigan205s002700 [Vigna angularis]